MKKQQLCAVMLGILFTVASTISFSASNFNISPTPGRSIPHSVPQGGLVSAYYTVVNNTSTTRSGYTIKGQPSTVRQNTSNPNNCSNPVVLLGHGQCILQLDISGEAKSSFALCNGSNCTTASIPLNISILEPIISVGSYRNDSGGYAPIAYTSNNNGANWALGNGGAVLTLPSNSQTGSNAITQLQSVACSSSGLQCTAVGFYQRTNQSSAPLLSYNTNNAGANWSLGAPFPEPQLSAGSSFFLSSVACDATGLRCSTVGSYRSTSSNSVPLSYSSNNGGNSWSLSSPLPLPADILTTASASSTLASNSCDNSALLCTAVGYYKKGTGANHATSDANVPLSYTSINGGDSWSLSSTLPLPADVLTTNSASTLLSAVACDLSGQVCTAVGYYKKGSGANHATYNGRAPLSYNSVNGGHSWTLSNSLPLPDDVLTTSAADTQLRAVSCDASGLLCTAVGLYTRGTGSNNTIDNGTNVLSYVSKDSGNSWILSNTAPLPANAATGSSSTVTTLLGVKCDSTGLLCNAVGQYSYIGSVNYSALPLSYTSVTGGMTWILSNTIPLAVDSDSSPDTVLASIH